MTFWGHPEDGSSRVLQNTGNLPYDYTASQIRRQLESSSPWKSQILRWNYMFHTQNQFSAKW